MAIFAGIFRVIEIVVISLAIFQFIFEWVRSRPNYTIGHLGEKLGEYMNQIVEFLTYKSDDIPFPFSDLP